MSKASITAVKTTLQENVSFFHDLALAAQKAMEADVIRAMKIFGGKA